MELCSESLRHWLQKRNENNTSVDNRLQMLEWFKQICEGVNYIHESGEHGMIHRDLKPDNILLTEENQIKISDLGLATENPYNTHTIGVGTQLYTPDEQKGTNYGKAVDIFPLGIKFSVLKY